MSKIIDPVYIRGSAKKVYGTVAAGNLDSGACAAGDYLHTDVITFSNAFIESNESKLKIVGVMVFENCSAGVLQMNEFELQIYNQTKDVNTIIKNHVLSTYDFLDINVNIAYQGKIAVATADYEIIASGSGGTNAFDAIAYKMLDKPIYCYNYLTGQNLFAVLKCTDTTTGYDATDNLTIAFLYEDI